MYSVHSERNEMSQPNMQVLGKLSYIRPAKLWLFHCLLMELRKKMGHFNFEYSLRIRHFYFDLLEFAIEKTKIEVEAFLGQLINLKDYQNLMKMSKFCKDFK